MPTPKINPGAFGPNTYLGGAVRQGVSETLTAIEQEGQQRQQFQQESELRDLKGQAVRQAMAKQEREYRKDFTLDPEATARQSVEIQRHFEDIQTGLFDLRKKQIDGTITDEESLTLAQYENSIQTFNSVYTAENEAIKAYNEILDSTGVDDYSSPKNRALAMALAKKELKLTQRNGEWYYEGEVTYTDENGKTVTERVDDKAVGFLDNLNLTEKTDWGSSDADAVAGVKVTSQTQKRADGSEYVQYKYDPNVLISQASADLADRNKLNSYAFHYLTDVKGLSDAEARQQVDDLDLDGYGDFKTELLNHHTTELIKAADARVNALSYQSVAAKPTERKTTWTPKQHANFSANINNVAKVLSQGGNLSSIAPGELRSTYDKEKKAWTIEILDDVGDAIVEETFTNQRAAENFALGHLGVDPGFISQYRATQANNIVREAAANRKFRDDVFAASGDVVDDPRVQTGEPYPENLPEDSVQKAAILQAWAENNYGRIEAQRILENLGLKQATSKKGGEKDPPKPPTEETGPIIDPGTTTNQRDKASADRNFLNAYNFNYDSIPAYEQLDNNPEAQRIFEVLETIDQDIADATGNRKELLKKDKHSLTNQFKSLYNEAGGKDNRYVYQRYGEYLKNRGNLNLVPQPKFNSNQLRTLVNKSGFKLTNQERQKAENFIVQNGEEAFNQAAAGSKNKTEFLNKLT